MPVVFEHLSFDKQIVAVHKAARPNETLKQRLALLFRGGVFEIPVFPEG